MSRTSRLLCFCLPAQNIKINAIVIFAEAAACRYRLQLEASTLVKFSSRPVGEKVEISVGYQEF